MRTFQQDYTEARKGRKADVLSRRKAKLDSLKEQLATSRGYTKRCLEDRIALLQEEYEEIASIAEGV